MAVEIATLHGVELVTVEYLGKYGDEPS